MTPNGGHVTYSADDVAQATMRARYESAVSASAALVEEIATQNQVSTEQVVADIGRSVENRRTYRELSSQLNDAGDLEP